MSGNTLTLALRLTADGKALQAEVRQSRVEVQGLGTTAVSTGRNLDGLTSQSNRTGNSLRGLEGDSRNVNNSLRLLTATAGGLFAAFSAANLADGVKDQVQQYQDLRTRLTQLTGSAQGYAAAEQYLVQLGNDHHKEIAVLSDSYAKLLVLQNSGILTQQQARDILEGMSNATSSLGGSSAQLGQVMFGLSQGLTSGTLRAEEFNQIMEPMPGLLQAVEKANGLTAGSLRQLVNAGQVTSSMFRDYLIRGLREFDGASAATADNITAKSADVANAAYKVAAALARPVGSAYGSSLTGIANALAIVADNADILAPTLGVVLTAAASRGVVALGSLTVARVADFQATRLQAQENLRLAQTEAAAAAAEVSRLRIMEWTGGVTTQLTAATNNYAAAQARLVAAETAAAGVGARLLGVLGGPMGLALTVGTLAYSFLSLSDGVEAANDALPKVEPHLSRIDVMAQRAEERMRSFKQTLSGMKAGDIAGEIDKLQKALDHQQLLLSRAQRDFDRGAVTSELVATRRQEVEQAQRRLDEARTALGVRAPQDFKEAEKYIGNLKEQVALLGKQTELAKANAQLETNQLKASPGQAAKIRELAATVDAANAQKKLNDSSESQLLNLREEIALNGSKSRLVKVNFDLEFGALKGLAPDRAKALRDKAQELDLLRRQTEQAAYQAALQEKIATRRRQVEMATSGIGQGDLERQNLQELLALQQEYAQKREEMARQQGTVNGLPEVDYQARLQQLQAAQDEETRIIQDGQRKQAEARLNAGNGFERALQNYSNGIRDIAGQTETLFTHAFQGAEDALVEFVKTGKLDLAQLKDMVITDVIRMLIRMGLQMAANALLSKSLTAAAAAGYVVQISGQAGAQVAMAGLNAFSATAAIPLVGPALAGPAAMAAIAAATPMAASAIGAAATSLAGVAHDGIGRIPAGNEGTWLLRKDEMVLNPTQTDNFEQLLGFVKSQQSSGLTTAGGSGGARRLTVILRNEGGEKLASRTAMTKTIGDEEFVEIVMAARDQVAQDIAEGGNNVDDAFQSAYGMRRAGS